jgi:hypothetical protein
MLVLEDVLSQRKLWYIFSVISHVFLKAKLQVSAGMTDIS